MSMRQTGWQIVVMHSNDLIKEKVARYYTDKLNEHGASHWGVDWNSTESQFLRFQQLLSLMDTSTPFSINDFGCGYGALVEYLENRQLSFTYAGYDLSEAMIAVARSTHGHKPHIRFFTGDAMEPADYTVASGIFNVRLDCPDSQWESHILTCIDRMNQASTRGFAFNMLTRYSDPEYRKDYLYYADPCYYFDYLKGNVSKDVAILHHYGLYEFTVFVNKDHLRSKTTSRE